MRVCIPAFGRDLMDTINQIETQVFGRWWHLLESSMRSLYGKLVALFSRTDDQGFVILPLSIGVVLPPEAGDGFEWKVVLALRWCQPDARNTLFFKWGGVNYPTAQIFVIDNVVRGPSLLLPEGQVVVLLLHLVVSSQQIWLLLCCSAAAWDNQGVVLIGNWKLLHWNLGLFVWHG